MKIELLQKAKRLEARIKTLERQQKDFRPGYCNGVGICKVNMQYHYVHRFHSTSSDRTEDSDSIMRAMIQAAYNEVTRLLLIAKEDLKNL